MRDKFSFIKQYEIPSLNARKNLLGEWFVGYNYTIGIYNGKSCTLEQADKYLYQQITFIHNQLICLFGTSYYKLSSKQLIALTSLIFHLGIDLFRQSHVIELVKDGDLVSARKQFAIYSKMGIIVKRSEEEIKLF